MAVLLGFCWVCRTSADVPGSAYGARSWTRTNDPLINSQVLYPAELFGRELRIVVSDAKRVKLLRYLQPSVVMR